MSLFTPPQIHDSQRWRGRRIGLFGGSFDPPHAGHCHAAFTALKMLELDFIWWLVTPQNPLKFHQPDALEERITLCREIAVHPRMLVSDIEAQMGTFTTLDSVSALQSHFPDTEFVWVGGMDIAHGLHRWRNWKELIHRIPFAFVTRPPADSLVQACPLKNQHFLNHIYLKTPQKWELSPKNTFWIMQKKMLDISSSEIRKSI